jgi:hypothetical protein
MEFNPFDLSVKDLSTRNMITRCNSSELLYTMCLPSHPTPSSPMSAPSALVASTSTWHRCLGHPGVDVLSKLSHDSSVVCSRCTQDLYHACQLVHHICLPFVSSNSCADNNFDLIHCGLWTSPVVSVSGSNIIWLSLMITSILCGLFLCALNLTLFALHQKISLMSPHSLAALSKSSSAIMVVSSITPPLAYSSPPNRYFCGCLVPTLLHIMVKLSASFAPSIICYVPYFFRHLFRLANG